MLTDLFKKQNPISLIILFVLSFVGSYPSVFLHETASKEWFEFLSINWVQFTFASILLFSNGLIFNFIVHNFRVVSSTSYIPFLYFILCSVFFIPHSFIVSALSIFIIVQVFLFRILSFQNGNTQYLKVYDSAFIVGLLTLIHPTSVLLFPFVWISIGYFRSFDWREWVIPFLGFSTPVIYWVCYAFYEKQHFYLPKSPFLFNSYQSNYSLSTLAFFILAGAFLLLSIPGFLKYKSISVKKSSKGASVILILSIAGLISFFGFSGVLSLLIVTGISTLLAIMVLTAKKNRIIEPLTWGLVAVFLLRFFL